MRVIDVDKVWARGERVEEYVEIVLDQAGVGEDEVVLIGSAPVWLYFVLSHALNGKCKKLIYSSPSVSVVVFDHT